MAQRENLARILALILLAVCSHRCAKVFFLKFVLSDVLDGLLLVGDVVLEPLPVRSRQVWDDNFGESCPGVAGL